MNSVCILRHPFISQFRECIHDDTKHNVKSNGRHNDEKCEIIEKCS